MLLTAYLKDFAGLLFPNTCAGCSRHLFGFEQVICTGCLASLPKTKFHTVPNNPVAATFWGRVPVDGAAAFLFFDKGNKVQRMLHRLKYKGQTAVGEKLGELYGADLKNDPVFGQASVILPVPLHPDKQKARGYNQSAFFAAGLGKSMGIPTDETVLVRNRFSESQTRKTRSERWENVRDIFSVTNPERISGKTVLLVDDVLTTGSTLEACIAKLKSIEGVKVLVCTIAYAQ